MAILSVMYTTIAFLQMNGLIKGDHQLSLIIAAVFLVGYNIEKAIRSIK